MHPFSHRFIDSPLAPSRVASTTFLHPTHSLLLLPMSSSYSSARRRSENRRSRSSSPRRRGREDDSSFRRRDRDRDRDRYHRRDRDRYNRDQDGRGPYSFSARENGSYHPSGRREERRSRFSDPKNDFPNHRRRYDDRRDGGPGGPGGRFLDPEARRQERDSRPMPNIWADIGDQSSASKKSRRTDEFGRKRSREEEESSDSSDSSDSSSASSSSSSEFSDDSSSSSASESSSASDSDRRRKSKKRRSRRGRKESRSRSRRSRRGRRKEDKKRRKSREKSKSRRRKRRRSYSSSSSSNESSSESSSSASSSSSSEASSEDGSSSDSSSSAVSDHRNGLKKGGRGEREGKERTAEILASAEDGDLWEGAERNSLDAESSEDEVIGPRPPPKEAQMDARSYGKALLPGEGEAIGAFVAAGQRIPRRGEIGMTSEQIEAFERAGYVMSGSRHKRMNAIRIRKENQVYSAEEQRALSLMNLEEAAQREAELQAQFRRLVQRKKEEKGLDD